MKKRVSFIVFAAAILATASLFCACSDPEKQQGGIDKLDAEKLVTIAIADSAAHVSVVLGEPYVAFGEEKSNTLWKYYDVDYLNTSKRIDEKKASRQSALDRGDAAAVTKLTEEISELENHLSIMTYRYAEITFSETGADDEREYIVKSVMYDSVRNPGGVNRKTVKKVEPSLDDISTGSLPRALKNLTARVYYVDGSYINEWIQDFDYSQIDTSYEHTQSLSWSNIWGECSAEINIKNGIFAGSVFAGAFEGKSNNSQFKPIEVPFTLTALGNGTDDFTPDFFLTVERPSQQQLYSQYWISQGETPDPLFEKYKKNIVSLNLTSAGKLRNLMIGSGLFKGMEKLKSVTFPDGYITVGAKAFAGCKSLKEITIGGYVSYIAGSAFEACPIEKINIAPENTLFKMIGNCLVNDKTLVRIFGDDPIPSDGSVQFIEDGAFSGRSDLTQIEIPSAIIGIGDNAFSGCDRLVEKQDGVSYVGAWAVACDDSVATVALKNGTVGIADRLFYGCKNLTSISIPDSVKRIGDWAMIDCEALETINFGGKKAQWIAIDKGDNWDTYSGNYVVKCSDGEIAKKDTQS